MTATSTPSRLRESACPPANPQSYREAELGAALVADALFFLRHRDRFHRIRTAEIRVVQVLEGRLLEPTEGCTPLVLVQRVDEGRRRRIVIEADGVDCDAMGEAEIATLFLEVTQHGWTSISGGRHEA